MPELILQFIYVLFAIIAPFRCYIVSHTMIAYRERCLDSLANYDICTDEMFILSIYFCIAEGCILFVGLCIWTTYTVRMIMCRKVKSD
jgi:hypothetical protein